ncbi:hypothetical protein GGTG_11006 [Gaeumannomyces tritici R3-111a-1]|uniref:Uncharacterized protein n=1 Tax=Gaeumannomyces tritici (strain R3-111a-1) TaxID=644352 RepID=J3PBY2_GAET3|nr:hypothetical protein GGTG_11006 [Gaeumannomyces tritici R3-111a-1]EJT71752.1 hypothetical protein GGTG_11006 [Gaeumannomyces tritici R3-111a-1]
MSASPIARGAGEGERAENEGIWVTSTHKFIAPPPIRDIVAAEQGATLLSQSLAGQKVRLTIHRLSEESDAWYTPTQEDLDDTIAFATKDEPERWQVPRVGFASFDAETNQRSSEILNDIYLLNGEIEWFLRRLEVAVLELGAPGAPEHASVERGMLSGFQLRVTTAAEESTRWKREDGTRVVQEFEDIHAFFQAQRDRLSAVVSSIPLPAGPPLGAPTGPRSSRDSPRRGGSGHRRGGGSGRGSGASPGRGSSASPGRGSGARPGRGSGRRGAGRSHPPPSS